MTGFEKLENSLIDVIKEEQAKLGFKEEKIHLYYPLSSLNHFFSARTAQMKWQPVSRTCRKNRHPNWEK